MTTSWTDEYKEFMASSVGTRLKEEVEAKMIESWKKGWEKEHLLDPLPPPADLTLDDLKRAKEMLERGSAKTSISATIKAYDWTTSETELQRVVDSHTVEAIMEAIGEERLKDYLERREYVKEMDL